MSEKEKHYVIYEAPKKCNSCGKELIDIAIGQTMMGACPYCGLLTPKMIVVSEQHLSKLKRKGIKAIREFKQETYKPEDLISKKMFS